MTWTWYNWAKTKKDAEMYAERAKQRYDLFDEQVKIVKEKGGYTVYIAHFTVK